MADADETPTTESQTETTNTETAATKRPLSLLAAEMFGSDFHGEVPKPDSTEPETETSTETEPEETLETETAPPDGEPQEDLADLIRQHIETDPALLQKLKLGVKIDGQIGEASLDDLVRSYQIQSAAEKRLEEAKSKAKELLDDANGRAAKIDERFAVAEKLIEKAEAKLLSDIKKVNLEKLRQDDPAEWAAKTREFDQRRQEIEQDKREAVTLYEAASKKVQEEAVTKLRQHLQAETSVLLDKLPEWRDPEKAKAGKAKLAEYLITQGFTQQDVSGASDHRLILMARKAMLFDELQANTNAAKKRLATVPKVLKPGASKPHDQVNKERVDKLRDRLRKSGSIDDAFALLKAKRGK